MHVLVLPWIIYAIVSQPVGNALYIDNSAFAVTQYQLAQGYGLLAHTRPEWEELEVGQVLYADGQAFQGTELDELTAESFSRFRDDNGHVLTADDVLKRFFSDPNGLTLMTCLGSDGRLFVVARKVAQP